MRSGRWKLILPWAGEPRGAHNTGNEESQALELHDMSSDMGEARNVAEQNPEVVEKLLARCREFDAAAKVRARADKR